MKFLKRLFLILLPITVFPVFAYAAGECAKMPRSLPDLEIIDAESDIIYDFTLDRKAITRLSKGYSQSLAGQNGKSVDQYYDISDLLLTGSNHGLTVSAYSYELFIQPNFSKAGGWGNKFCIEIKKIAIRFKYQSKIYVASEYPVNGCGFNEIMEHEMKHHNINVTNKKKYLGWLQNDMQAIANAIVANYQPISQGAMKKTYIKAQMDIRDAIDAYVQKMYKDTDIQNKKLDSTSEYLRFGRAIRKCYDDQQKALKEKQLNE